MKLVRLTRILGGAALSLMILLGTGMLPAANTQAQDRDRHWDRDRDDRRDRDWDRDRDRDRDRDWNRRRDSRNRDRDWDRDRDRYRYNNSRGYPDYRSNTGYYGGNYAYSIGQQNGYSSGVEKGSDDARHNRRFNPTGSGRYRDGDHGYHSQYGSKDAYRSAFRSGFLRGYEVGYRQYAGYRRW